MIRFLDRGEESAFTGKSQIDSQRSSVLATERLLNHTLIGVWSAGRSRSLSMQARSQKTARADCDGCDASLESLRLPTWEKTNIYSETNTANRWTGLMKMDRANTSRWIATLCGFALVTVGVHSVNAQDTSSDASNAAATADPSAPPRLDPPVPPGREVEVPELDIDGRDQAAMSLAQARTNAPAQTSSPAERPTPAGQQKPIPADIDVPTIQPAELEPTDSFDPSLEQRLDDLPDDPSSRPSPRSRVEDTLRGYDASTMIDDDASLQSREDIIPRALSDEERTKLGITDGRFKLPTLAAPTTTQPSGEANRTPPSFADNQELLSEPLAESGADRSPDWHWSVCNWSAANTFSNPRYFEDRMLERHGHERWGHLQSVAAGARFFATFPVLPYLCTVSDPCECEYTLGYLRSGSCAPVMLQRPPWEKRAAIVEAAVLSGVIVGFP